MPLSIRPHLQAVEDAICGADVSFTGVVRTHDGGRAVTSLHYDAHPSADVILDGILARVGAAHRGIRALAASHRIGTLPVGDIALAVAVSAGHRAEAFACCADVVETIKRVLPVWKRRLFEDGSDEWVNLALYSSRRS
ncbi:molybdenum cofactor biosynthesis protein MoaE [Phytoactinopolyspora endophytica]|uniref:molybdenum cofactor biosynthesis protein MoaE n=1 Tax=Phytoactinopolyspora endophytica TaxID=1642495 RepID=UPI00101DA2F3|nr:molybdenum cofactor biosynthesis protein MoaE [Phytoactinopolyspora endophytica]